MIKIRKSYDIDCWASWSSSCYNLKSCLLSSHPLLGATGSRAGNEGSSKKCFIFIQLFSFGNTTQWPGYSNNVEPELKLLWLHQGNKDPAASSGKHQESAGGCQSHPRVRGWDSRVLLSASLHSSPSSNSLSSPEEFVVVCGVCVCLCDDVCPVCQNPVCCPCDPMGGYQTQKCDLGHLSVSV